MINQYQSADGTLLFSPSQIWAAVCQICQHAYEWYNISFGWEHGHTEEHQRTAGPHGEYNRVEQTKQGIMCNISFQFQLNK